MEKEFSLEKKIFIQASKAEVWNGLTNPDLIRQWMFGTEATSDWKVGSIITYKGEWEGQKYEDKGLIREVEPEESMYYLFFSPMSGAEDVLENYTHIWYSLSAKGEGTELAVTQKKLPSAEARDKWAKNWQLVLEKLKEILES